MGKERLLAFTDGVIAIIITIMVLELRPPHEPSLTALVTVVPGFLSYVLSFLMVGIYWNNHHHFFHLVRHVDGLMLWANLHLLFWLSLIPFATAWVGASGLAPVPTAVYGLSFLMPALAWFAMEGAILRREGRQSPFGRAIGRDLKGKISPVLYAMGILFSFIEPRVAVALYALVGLMWLVPDRRIERQVRDR